MNQEKNQKESMELIRQLAVKQLQTLQTVNLNKLKKLEEKLVDKEDYYYKKFSSMETALSKFNCQTSSLSSLFGG